MASVKQGKVTPVMSMLEVEKHETFSLPFPGLDSRRQASPEAEDYHSRMSRTQGSHQNRMITTGGPIPGLLEEASD
jgi:hypothetical protein